MRFVLIALIAQFTFSTFALARDVYVNGYTKSNGTYVAPYVRTSPDNTINNNYGTQGNYNPNTGNWGTKPRDPSQPAYGSSNTYKSSYDND